jgi:Fanconi anemia group M protein
MTVWQDVHEKGSMHELVEAHCDHVRRTDDFGGDYAVGGFLIERKTWAEVAGRMQRTEGDLAHQLDKLTDAAELLDLTPALLIEGEVGSRLTHSAMPPDAIARHLAGFPLMGVTVLFSTGQRCSARIIACLEDGEPPDVRRVRGTADSDDHAASFVIEGFPGVGPATADALLEHLGSVEAVVTATEDELTSVPGVGPATAGRIIDVRSRGPGGRD